METTPLTLHPGRGFASVKLSSTYTPVLNNMRVPLLFTRINRSEEEYNEMFSSING